MSKEVLHLWFICSYLKQQDHLKVDLIFQSKFSLAHSPFLNKVLWLNLILYSWQEYFLIVNFYQFFNVFLTRFLERLFYVSFFTGLLLDLYVEFSFTHYQKLRNLKVPLFISSSQFFSFLFTQFCKDIHCNDFSSFPLFC